MAISAMHAAGCGKPDAPAAPETNAAARQADAESDVLAAAIHQMDRLGRELRQDQPQRPSFELPSGAGLLPLGRRESEQHMQQAARLVEGGDLPAALAQLYGCQFDVEDPQTYRVLRAEVEALWFEQQRAFPLAARCAAYALLHYPKSVVAAEVRQRLKSRRGWAWRYEGAFAAGNEAQAAGANLPAYWVQGYSNAALPALAETAAPTEVLHFVCFPAQFDDYLCSYVFKTRVLPGGQRIALLLHLAQGRPRVLEVYEQVPPYDQAVREIQQRLAAQELAPAGGGA